MKSGTSLAQDKNRQLLHSINLLYAAVCNLEAWPAFLESAAELFDARGAQVGHHDLMTNALSFSRLHGYEWDAEHYLKYDALMAEDPRLAYFMSNPFRPVHCRMGLDEKTLHESRVYKEVLYPGEVEYSLGVSLSEDRQSLSYLIALRDREQPPFDDSQCALLQELIPHLRRAMLLQREMATLDYQKDASVKALDAMAVGIIMLDAETRIRFANGTAKSILEGADGLRETGGRLEVTAGDNTGLKQRIRKIIADASTGKKPSGETLQIVRSPGQAPYNAVISPFWGNTLRAGWPHIQEPQIFFVVRDPDHARETRQEALGRIYGLTPSQAALANLMCDGLSVRDAAQAWGITEASARQYLKIIFQKMNVRRQGEMISAIMKL